MEIQIEEALNLNLGSPALQYKVMPAKLGNGRKGFVAFYSACYDVDVHYSLLTHCMALHLMSTEKSFGKRNWESGPAQHCTVLH